MSQNDIQGVSESGQSNRMPIAQTIGGTIGFIGLILVLYGLFGGASYSQSDDININLWWGLLMVVFGIIMLVGGFISARRSAHQ